MASRARSSRHRGSARARPLWSSHWRAPRVWLQPRPGGHLGPRASRRSAPARPPRCSCWLVRVDHEEAVRGGGCLPATQLAGAAGRPCRARRRPEVATGVDRGRRRSEQVSRSSWSRRGRRWTWNERLSSVIPVSVAAGTSRRSAPARLAREEARLLGSGSSIAVSKMAPGSRPCVAEVHRRTSSALTPDTEGSRSPGSKGRPRCPSGARRRDTRPAPGRH